MLGLSSFTVNVYALPVVVVAVLIGLLGLYVAARERGARLGWLFLLFAWAVALYLFGAGISYALADSGASLAWARVAHVGVAYLPAAVVATTMEILGRRAGRRATVAGATAVSTLFAATVVFTDLFIRDNTRVPWGYYPVYGPAGGAFLGFFVVVMIAILVMYARVYRSSANDLHRRRLRGLLVAFIVGYLGAVDFLPAIGIDVYAFGYVPILAFVIIIATVIVRFRLVDITPAVAAEQILHTMHGAVIVTDLAGTIRVANQAAQDAFSHAVSSIVGEPFSSLIATAQAPPELTGTESRIKNHELEIRDGSSRARILSVSASPLADGRNTAIGRVYVAHDITDRKEAEQKLEQLALFDPLTGLPNRVLFFDRLDQLLALARRNQYALAILYMDLDRFKEINDSLGHEAGDELLRQAARRMQNVTRSSDTIARMGGDEFIGVCGRVASTGDAEVVAAKLAAVLQQPFDLAGAARTVGVSIGIAVYPTDGEDSRTLLARADQAMYRVKATGRGGFLSYSALASD